MICMVSGGFDPLHVGHLDLLEGASHHGRVVVALNSDDWLIRKKGYAFMRWDDRARILNALGVVSGVTSVEDTDDTVCEALHRLRPRYFANGGDRTQGLVEERLACLELNITELFGVGGLKRRSSSQLVEKAR